MGTRVKPQQHEHGETTPRKRGRLGVSKIDRTSLAELVAEHPDATASELRGRLESAGAELAFLPPYSSALNPIEMVCSKIK